MPRLTSHLRGASAKSRRCLRSESGNRYLAADLSLDSGRVLLREGTGALTEGMRVGPPATILRTRERRAASAMRGGVGEGLPRLLLATRGFTWLVPVPSSRLLGLRLPVHVVELVLSRDRQLVETGSPGSRLDQAMPRTCAQFIDSQYRTLVRTERAGGCGVWDWSAIYCGRPRGESRSAR